MRSNEVYIGYVAVCVALCVAVCVASCVAVCVALFGSIKEKTQRYECVNRGVQGV